MHAEQFLIGVSGALLGVIGWLFVGMFMQRREHARHARDAGRAVYFELGANHLAVFTALEYGTSGPSAAPPSTPSCPNWRLGCPRPSCRRWRWPTWATAPTTRSLRRPAYLAEARRTALTALAETHRVAVELLRRRVFSPAEIASLGKYAGDRTHGSSRLADPADQSPATGP